MQTNIIGISPGTWQLAYAVYRNGNLVDWRLKRMKEPWSASKMGTITETLKAIIEGHKITHIAFKLPLAHESSKSHFAVINAITTLGKKYQIPCIGFGIDQLKKCYKSSDIQNKCELLQVIVAHQPEIKYEYEKKNERYYMKVFEAVACAHLLIKKIDENNL